MDGNGRWAKRLMLPRFAGHRAGVEAVRGIVRACAERGIEVLSLFAFSSENWRRPAQEVSRLMDLLLSAMQREAVKLHENNVRVRFIGERSAFSAKLRQQMDATESLTGENTGLTLVIAVNYGGRWDLTQAARAIASRLDSGELDAAEIDEDTIADHLALHDLPEPDLFIRTGGEQRISNFLLWNLAYTELYFTDTLWPDFDEPAFELALASFRMRQRRFGRTGEQVEQARGA
jgi:undecaprenyl diphosphate synthase